MISLDHRIVWLALCSAKARSQVTGLVKHFKTTQVLMSLYEKWREDYPYDYEFIDALHQNEVYSQL